MCAEVVGLLAKLQGDDFVHGFRRDFLSDTSPRASDRAGAFRKSLVVNAYCGQLIATSICVRGEITYVMEWMSHTLVYSL